MKPPRGRHCRLCGRDVPARHSPHLSSGRVTAGVSAIRRAAEHVRGYDERPDLVRANFARNAKHWRRRGVSL